MSPDIAETVRREHNATVEAFHRAQARAMHLGSLLLEVRQKLGPAVWDEWIEGECPIPAGVARRYANEARRLRQAA